MAQTHIKNFSANLFFDLISKSTDDYVFMWDIKNNIFKVSEEIFVDFELAKEVKHNVVGYWPTIMASEDVDYWLKGIKDVVQGKTKVHDMEYRLINKSGEVVWVSCRGKVDYDKENQPKLMVGRISNIGKNNKFDNTTGVKSRQEFGKEMNQIIKAKNIEQGTLVYLDVDNFKNFNERFGHSFGDKLLFSIVEKIRTQLPDECQLYRLDGDEFAFFYPNSTNKQIEEIFNKIQLLLARNIKVEGKQLFISISAGACMYPEDGDNYIDLSKHADSAIEIAKFKGKNQITFFSKKVHNRKLKNIEYQEALHRCVDNGFDEFELYYQPQIDTITKKVVGAEALLRWHSKEFGEISPVEFIPLLEENNLIVAVGKWVYDQAIQQCLEWQKDHENFLMSINVSYIQLKEPNLIPYLKKTMKANKLDPNTCILELTENCWIPDLNIINEGFKDLQKAGYDIAIDDFGTGYSSLNYLKKLPVNLIKIDRSFVQGIKANSYEYTFLEYIIKLAHIIHLKVCVEGVESWSEFDVVEKSKPDYIQGFLFGKPVNHKEFEKLFFEA
ncbi:MAG: GGDEF and EAL domain-containing protein [Erysipelotrichaceae bacterium]